MKSFLRSANISSGLISRFEGEYSKSAGMKLGSLNLPAIFLIDITTTVACAAVIPGKMAITEDTTAERKVGTANGFIGGRSQFGSCFGISDVVT